MKAKHEFKIKKDYKDYLTTVCTIKFAECSIMLDNVNLEDENEMEELVNHTHKLALVFVEKLLQKIETKK